VHTSASAPVAPEHVVALRTIATVVNDDAAASLGRTGFNTVQGAFDRVDNKFIRLCLRIAL